VLVPLGRYRYLTGPAGVGLCTMDHIHVGDLDLFVQEVVRCDLPYYECTVDYVGVNDLDLSRQQDVDNMSPIVLHLDLPVVTYHVMRVQWAVLVPVTLTCPDGRMLMSVISLPGFLATRLISLPLTAIACVSQPLTATVFLALPMCPYRASV
jgi:hypothetical protein